jgi:hypothetical protein
MIKLSEKLKKALNKENIELTPQEMQLLADVTDSGKLDDEKMGNISGGAISSNMKKALGVAAVVGALAVGTAARFKPTEGLQTQESEISLRQTPEEYMARLNAIQIPLTPVKDD